MSVPSRVSDGKITVPSLLHRKSLSPRDSTKITCLTAYDYPTARLLDEAGVEVLLVGDSLGMVMLGHETTLPVTVDEMLHHTRAVRKGTKRALVVADMPFGSYHSDLGESVRNAVRFVKEAEIPVMGHVGLTPQSLHAMGGFKVQGKTPDAAEQLVRDARAVEAAGAFAIVLEGIPRELAALITRELRIPTIGIGAGPECDGQILVINDLLGLTFGPGPKFARQDANLSEIISSTAREYCADVRRGSFPPDAESYHMPKPKTSRKDINFDVELTD